MQPKGSTGSLVMPLGHRTLSHKRPTPRNVKGSNHIGNGIDSWDQLGVINDDSSDDDDYDFAPPDFEKVKKSYFDYLKSNLPQILQVDYLNIHSAEGKVKLLNDQNARWDQLREKYPCPICCDVLAASVIFNCSHQCCGECLERMITSYQKVNFSEPDTEVIFRCPLCNSEVDCAILCKSLNELIVSDVQELFSNNNDYTSFQDWKQRRSSFSEQTQRKCAQYFEQIKANRLSEQKGGWIDTVSRLFFGETTVPTRLVENNTVVPQSNSNALEQQKPIELLHELALAVGFVILRSDSGDNVFRWNTAAMKMSKFDLTNLELVCKEHNPAQTEFTLTYSSYDDWLAIADYLGVLILDYHCAEGEEVKNNQSNQIAELFDLDDVLVKYDKLGPLKAEPTFKNSEFQFWFHDTVSTSYAHSVGVDMKARLLKIVQVVKTSEPHVWAAMQRFLNMTLPLICNSLENTSLDEIFDEKNVAINIQFGSTGIILGWRNLAHFTALSTLLTSVVLITATQISRKKSLANSGIKKFVHLFSWTEEEQVRFYPTEIEFGECKTPAFHPVYLQHLCRSGSVLPGKECHFSFKHTYAKSHKPGFGKEPARQHVGHWVGPSWFVAAKGWTCCGHGDGWWTQYVREDCPVLVFRCASCDKPVGFPSCGQFCQICGVKGPAEAEINVIPFADL